MKKVTLNKVSYKYKDVAGLLGDQMGFSEFKTKPPTINGFFKLYNENFYNLDKSVHNNFIVKSEDYVGTIDNLRNLEIERLKQRIETVQLEIDSADREHPYFVNGTIIMHKDYNVGYTSGNGGIDSEGRIKGPRYYMHSGKKRPVSGEYTLYSKIKNRLGMKGLKDSEVIVFLWPGGLDSIAEGPPVDKIQDLFISSYEVNMYKPNS